MLPRLIEQVAILATAAALLAVPGAALVSLLRVRAALPDSLAVPAGAVFGALVACAATLVQLTLELRVVWAVALHGTMSLLLVAAALALRRRRRRSTGRTTAVTARGWARTTTGLVVLGALAAWVVRGSVRLDTLYHVSVSRKLVELGAPSFDNVNRFVDGGPNPAYALPGWHGFVGWTSWLTGTDPILAWEILPVLMVALGALAAGGLARVLLQTPVAEPLGALAWLSMRVLFGRREVDGDAIAYGAVPGQVVFEVALPLVLAGVVVAIWNDDARARRAALAAATAGIALTVVLHANYIVYVPIVGLGYVAWWLAAGPVTRLLTRRTIVAGGVVAAACAAFVAVLLPVLAQLENFGNAPENARIDYHLAQTAGFEHIRGGHLYEMLGMPGLVALLAAPVVALLWRGPRMHLASGGLLAVGAFSLLPPLHALLAATGSLTIGLRINHVAGILLVPVLAAAVLLAAGAIERRFAAPRRRLAVAGGALVLLVAAGVGFGYGRFLPDWPGYLAWFALLGVLGAKLATRRRGAAAAPDPAPSRRALALVAAVLVMGTAMPVGLVSMRRAVLNADPLSAGTAAGELECLSGDVADALRRVPAGSIVLSDPLSSFRALALAPVYVVGDYKVWNAATSDNRTEQRLALVNRFFDSSLDDEQRLQVLDEQDVDYLLVDLADARWLDVADGSADSPLADEHARAWRVLDWFADVQAYDGGMTARLVSNHPERFELVELDERGRRAALPRPEPHIAPPCNSYALWRVRG